MPSHGTDLRVLERCCVQFSAPIQYGAPQLEFTHAESFLRAHARTNPIECGTALVYRVETSERNDDRLGAWLLLDSVIRLAVREQQDAITADRVAKKARRKAQAASEAELTSLTIAEDQPAPSPRASGPAATRSDVCFNGVLDTICGFLPALLRHRWDEAAVSERLQLSYRAMRNSWTRMFHASLVSEIRDACEAVRAPRENGGGPRQDISLVVPDRLTDACWKLRRETPRPSSAVYVRRLYFGEGSTSDDLKLLLEQGRSRVPHVHPRAAEWVLKICASDATFCLRCDVWSHSETYCPAAPEHIAKLEKPLLGAARSTLETMLGHGALEEHSPKSLGLAAQVLDKGAALIMDERSPEGLLCAYDALRGGIASGPARSALFVLASYRLLPSWVVDFTAEKGDDDDVDGIPTRVLRDTASLAKARAHLATNHRRLREAHRLDSAVRVLALEFAGRIDPQMLSAIRDVRDEKGFIFAAVALDSIKAGQRKKPTPPKKPRGKKGETEDVAPGLPLELFGGLDHQLSLLPEHSQLTPWKDEINVLCRRTLSSRLYGTDGLPPGTTGYYDVNLAVEWLSRHLKIDMRSKTWLDSAKSEITLRFIDLETNKVKKDEALLFARSHVALAILAGENHANPLPMCSFCTRSKGEAVMGWERAQCPNAMEAVATGRELAMDPRNIRLLPWMAKEKITQRQRVVSDRRAAATRARDDEAKEAADKRARMADRDVMDMKDCMQFYTRREPRIGNAVTDAFETIHNVFKRDLPGGALSATGYSPALLPALCFLHSATMEQVLEAMRANPTLVRRATRHATFPATEAVELAVITILDRETPMGDPNPPSRRVIEGVSSRVRDELRQEVPLAELALRRSRAAQVAWDRPAVNQHMSTVTSLRELLETLNQQVLQRLLRIAQQLVETAREVAASVSITALVSSNEDWSQYTRVNTARPPPPAEPERQARKPVRPRDDATDAAPGVAVAAGETSMGFPSTTIQAPLSTEPASLVVASNDLYASPLDEQPSKAHRPEDAGDDAAAAAAAAARAGLADALHAAIMMETDGGLHDDDAAAARSRSADSMADDANASAPAADVAAAAAVGDAPTQENADLAAAIFNF